MKIISQYALGSQLAPGDATLANLTSQIFPTESCMTVSLVATAVGGTITGSIQIQVSNDPVEQTNQVVNWASPTGNYVLGISAAGVVSTSIPDYCWKWMQVVYTKATSATGAGLTVAIKSDGI